jgi:hypothetical protein
LSRSVALVIFTIDLFLSINFLPKYSPTLAGVKIPAVKPYKREYNIVCLVSSNPKDLQIIFHFLYCKKMFTNIKKDAAATK